MAYIGQKLPAPNYFCEANGEGNFEFSDLYACHNWWGLMGAGSFCAYIIASGPYWTGRAGTLATRGHVVSFIHAHNYPKFAIEFGEVLQSENLLGFVAERSNGAEEILQRDKGEEIERGSGARETYAVVGLPKESDSAWHGQLPCQVHRNQFPRSHLPCLLRRHDLLLPCRSPPRAPPPWAPPARSAGPLIHSFRYLSHATPFILFLRS